MQTKISLLGGSILREWCRRCTFFLGLCCIKLELKPNILNTYVYKVTNECTFVGDCTRRKCVFWVLLFSISLICMLNKSAAVCVCVFFYLCILYNQHILWVTFYILFFISRKRLRECSCICACSCVCARLIFLFFFFAYKYIYNAIIWIQ